MLDLGRISLIAVDSVYVGRTVKAMKHCLHQAQFKNVFLFTDARVDLPPEIVKVPIPRLSGLEAYSEFMLLDLPVYRTMLGDYVLIVQHDGFIINPAAWSDQFLDYDYIGAVWPDGVVGNGGFSLRSCLFLEALAHLKSEIAPLHPEDAVIGRQMRGRLEAAGIRFAPAEVANRFSVENRPYVDSFGYHGHNTERVSGFNIDNIDNETAEMEAHEVYYRAKYTPSDLNEHVETLRRLAKECRHITEFCTHTDVSTSAFLYARPAKLVSYNPVKQLGIGLLQKLARETGVHFDFVVADVLQISIEPTDLLFIDTYHVYEQTAQELALHADKVSRYLVFHDTTTYGEHGETQGHRGIWPAVQEFMQNHPRWSLAEKHEHNHGLTVLRRIA